MSKFQLVETLFPDVKGMTGAQARTLRDLILEENSRDILEIGFTSGISSAFIAAIMHDAGAGHLTALAMQSAETKAPNLDTLLAKTALSHLVSPLYCKRSYLWEMQRLITSDQGPTFDFCYFGGGLTWDQVGFGVVLANLLLRPGGRLVLANMDWSMGRSPYYKARPDLTRRYDSDEVASTPVRLVWDAVLPSLGFEKLRELEEEHWGIARKPL